MSVEAPLLLVIQIQAVWSTYKKLQKDLPIALTRKIYIEKKIFAEPNSLVFTHRPRRRQNCENVA